MLENNENFMRESICVGDPSAFHALYVKYSVHMRSLVSHDVHHKQDIDDMVQIIFLNAFQRFKECRSYSTLYAWLYSIAMDSIENYYRNELKIKSSTFFSFDGVDEVVDALNIFNENSAEEICSAMETGLEIVRLIANLPPLLKKALLLREIDGMSYGEIAIKMGCPMGTVRSRIHRVRAEIRKRLEKDD
ncbi:sigma-70 family RNA polymerase sigma factor [Janthinobacterium sp. RB2P8]|uniref:sigma-70 family RNA polymerase sigma factor n=1 Tax=Janthinobacterium sp. RB2P8 TaxID=3424191 RepID=UPI003F223687